MCHPQPSHQPHSRGARLIASSGSQKRCPPYLSKFPILGIDFLSNIGYSGNMLSSMEKLVVETPLVIYYYEVVGWELATMANVSGAAIGLARSYLVLISRIERGDRSVSEEERQQAHDELIWELQKCGIQGIGIDYDGRANARELAFKIDRWLRE